MNNLKFEFKKLLNGAVISFITVFLLGSAYVVQKGIDLYQDQLTNCEEFRLLEQAETEKSISNIKKGLRGRYIFKFRAKPAPIWALFHSLSPLYSMEGILDNTGVLLNISSNIDKNIFKKQGILDFDLSIYLILLLSLASTILGLTTTHVFKHIKISINNTKKFCIVFYSYLARLIYLLSTILLLLCIVFLLFKSNSVPLSQTDINKIYLFFIFSTLVLIFFFSLGAFAAMFKSFLKYLFLFLIWPCLLFFVPEGVKLLSNTNISNTLSPYKNELKKHTIWTDFENDVIDNVKKQKSVFDKRKFLELKYNQFVNEELMDIKVLENSVIEQNIHISNDVNKYSILFPLSSYFNMCRELSSMGYSSFIDFYKYLNQTQLSIIKAHMLNRKLDDLNFVYPAKSNLPNYFLYSLLFTLLYVVFSTFLLFQKFKKSSFPDNKMSLDGLEIVNNKVNYVFLTVRSRAHEFSDKFFRLLFSKDKFNGQIEINGKSILDHKIFYLPNLNGFEIADLKLLFGVKSLDGIESEFISDFSIDELSILFPKIKTCSLLILDNTNFNNIKPGSDITILEINSQVVKRNYDVLHYIYTDETGSGYEVRLRENSW